VARKTKRGECPLLLVLFSCGTAGKVFALSTFPQAGRRADLSDLLRPARNMGLIVGGNNTAAEYVNSVMADLKPFCRYSAQTSH
jgi:hypothetical protein